MNTLNLEFDLVVIGGGTGGPMAAVKAKEANPKLRVLLIDKANVKRSGAISMGMDGLNNAVIPGHATPEQYVKEITVANDGIVDQEAVMAYAANSFAMIEELDRWGVKFEKDETGDYSVRKVHHLGAYVLPMPEGHHMKRILYRQLKRARVEITNRVVVTRVLTGADGQVAAVMGFDCRTAELVLIRTKAAVISTGAAGRLGLPSSGYLMGTYENPTNCGDGHAMAFHAGAALANLECFQINPLIKDYNGPACAYVTGPLGGYTANAHGQRFIECDYWSGQMMQEFHNELQSGNGPVFLKLDHLAEETIQEIETILHSNERPSRGRFHEGRGTNYRQKMIEMHISEIGFCSGHSASGIHINARGETSVPGLYAAGDCASVPHNYMLGAFVYGKICGEQAAAYCAGAGPAQHDAGAEAAEAARILAPLQRSDGLTPFQIEYKTRRLVNDYLQPPKVTRKFEIGLQRFGEIREDLGALHAANPHELMRAMEAHSILDCAEMAARASLYRTESRWGLYHACVDHPERDDANWFCHVLLSRGAQGEMRLDKRAIEPYIVPVDDAERSAYQRLRIAPGSTAAPQAA
ncbi:fumarate reductase/succinate dehydrogenase flavoprotein subunit [Aquabacterium sp. OR-4]|uniref:fumarate reductase/succinate dehydrogenase flavoprotein subunit n=1 Tax=Aquabacterium sp. OR-4 TaxID=2978127 RepID=UPI0021B388E1|nr:fumarate reductase/succinate dehydrogenase flavoprotein subunit [Aquabacterium sp. OR-4]MDT7834539.1 fumarate reductase/succinate dehydrogenase flavoprotein subunit [Aquabacterium sp. OR-4]